MTIVECAKEVLADAGQPLAVKEIYDIIIDKHLYHFNTPNPIGVLNNQIRRRCVGLEFPSAHPIKFFSLVNVDGAVKYSLIGQSGKPNTGKAVVVVDTEKSPEELLIDAFHKRLDELKQELLELVRGNSPEFFEHLVLDLLMKMDFGYDKSSGIVTRYSHDGGIDGVISEDKLGLEKIYIQAKRYTNSKVGSKEVQAFIGAMGQVQKGVFITTSGFTKEALKFANSQQQKNIKLIDGDLLVDLLIKYKVGLQVMETLYLYNIDTEYYGSL